MFPFLASVSFPTNCRFIVRTSFEGVNVAVVPTVDEEEQDLSVDTVNDDRGTHSSVASISKDSLVESLKIKSARSKDSLNSHSPRRTPRSVSSVSPSSARLSPKVSPRATPIVPAQPVKAVTQRKALDVSPAMLEFFGGGGTSHGAESCFSKVPPQPTDQGRFGRKNLLERESREESPFRSTYNQVPQSTLPCFQTIDDHNARYESCKKNVGWNSSSSHFNVIPQCSSAPGPDLGEDEEHEIAEEACPVTSIPAEQFKQLSMRCNLENGKSPTEDSDWHDAAEDVLRNEITVNEEEPARSARKKSRGSDRTSLLDVPGPEIASDSEEHNEEPFADRASIQGEAEESSNGVTTAKADTPATTPAHDEKSMTPEQEAGSPKQSNGDQNNADSDDAGHLMRDGTMPAPQNASRGATGFGEVPILIRGGQIVNDDAIFTADVLIEDRVIRQVSTSITPPPNAIVIEAAGKMVLPAGIDVHTDFATSGSIDDFALGTKAALAGGTTTVIDVVIPESASESLVAAFDRVKSLAEAKAHCNLALSVCVNRWSEAVKQELRQLVERGVNSFILDLNNDSDLFQAFEQCKSLGAHARILPENKNVVALLEKRMLQMGISGPEGYIQSRPAFLEGEQVHRMCVLSQLTNCPFSVLSVTSSQSCRAVAAGRSNGSLVNAEIAVAAFASEPDAYYDKDIKKASSLLLAAPVRKETRNAEDLLDLMANSPLCVCVSDHRAIKSTDRTSCTDFTNMPRGCSASEERLPVLWEKAVYSGLIDPMRFVAITSSNAAKIFNLYPKKGRIAVGADADILVWNPKGTQQISAKAHWSSADTNVFEGLTVHATSSATICEGRLVYQDGKINIVSKGNMGTGRFVALQPNSPHVFGVVQARERMNTPEKVDRVNAEIRRNEYSDSRPITGTGSRGQVEGVRSQFESTFSVSGAGDMKNRASTKIIQPPGGKTTGFWPADMSSAILIKNGTVVNDDAMMKADVFIQGGVIVDVQPNISINNPDVRVIDATNKMVIPGGIDPHTHLQLPFMGTVAIDDFYGGTRAALAGGTTMIIDFVIGQRGTMPIDSWRQWREWADPNVCCDYGLSVAVTSWSPQIAEQMAELTKPEYGINSFKFFLAYKESFMVNDDEFFEGLKQCAKIGALARVHAENGHVIQIKQKSLLQMGVTGPEGHTQSRPEELEAEATNRACILAAQANCPLYVVHVMSKNAARAIAYHRQKGNVVFGEPIAAGLVLDGSGYYDNDWMKAAALVMSPPLSRDPSTPTALMDLLACGQLHLTGTDNCTFTCEQKKRGMGDFTKIPNGVNGLEDRMSLIWEKGVHTGKLDPMRFVAVTSTMAAKIFNCYPQKGRIARGSDADVVIWDPLRTRVISASTHHQALDYNVYEGIVAHGVAEITICKGKIVWENNQLAVEKGSGKYVPLLPFNNFVFASIPFKEQMSRPYCVPRGEDQANNNVANSNNPADQIETSANAEATSNINFARRGQQPAGGVSSIVFAE